jgi:hypothetical protein
MILYKQMEGRGHSPKKNQGGQTMKTTIKVSGANGMDKLAAALDDVQARAKVRTISADEMVEALEGFRKRVGVTKKAFIGTRVTVSLHSQLMPGAYKYVPEGTVFNAEYRAGGWHITSIYRANVNTGGRVISAKLSEDAAAAVVERMERGGW